MSTAMEFAVGTRWYLADSIYEIIEIRDTKYICYLCDTSSWSVRQISFGSRKAKQLANQAISEEEFKKDHGEKGIIEYLKKLRYKLLKRSDLKWLLKIRAINAEIKERGGRVAADWEWKAIEQAVARGWEYICFDCFKEMKCKGSGWQGSGDELAYFCDECYELYAALNNKEW